MSNNLTVAPRREFQSFHDLPIVLDLDKIDADIAILGIPYGAPYSMDDVTNDQTNAPTHIRRYCERALRGIDRWDFDLGGPLLDGRLITVHDVTSMCGMPTFVRHSYVECQLSFGIAETEQDKLHYQPV
jgi:agmatinase